jgi:hypothetical protein
VRGKCGRVWGSWDVEGSVSKGRDGEDLFVERTPETGDELGVVGEDVGDTQVSRTSGGHSVQVPSSSGRASGKEVSEVRHTLNVTRSPPGVPNRERRTYE